MTTGLTAARNAGRAAFCHAPYERVVPRGHAYSAAHVEAVTEIVHAEFNPFERGTLKSKAFVDGWNEVASAAADALL